LIVMGFRSASGDDRFPAELESLFAAYRTSTLEVEASAEFMPRLWERIEGQQTVTYNFGRFARGFVSVAAGLCLMLSTSFLTPPQISTSKNGTYVDFLADDTDDSPDTAAI